jgi:hypothetical protein
MIAWLQKKPLKPMIIPATNPDTRQRLFSHRLSRFFNSAMPSTIMLLPRDTIRPIRPQDNAPATAEESATRKATLEIGTNTVNSQV